MRLAETVHKITSLFEQHALPDASKEAEYFIRQVLNFSLTDYVLQKDKELSAELHLDLFAKAQRRAQGEPLAYIVGYRDFYKERFVVNKSVLIPRSDTETLVEEALRLPTPKRFADLGAGSGCIGLSLLKEWPQSRLTTIDISQNALQVARENAQRLKVEDRVDFVYGDVREQHFSELFDLIVSNPPYIAFDDPRVEKSVKAHEPHTALFAKEGGLFCYKMWTPWAKNHLCTGGWLLYECGEGQAEDVQSICLQNGFKNIKIIKDLAFKERVVAAQRVDS